MTHRFPRIARTKLLALAAVAALAFVAGPGFGAGASKAVPAPAEPGAAGVEPGGASPGGLAEPLDESLDDGALGLADSVALHATVFGPRAERVVALPARVPLDEIDFELPDAKPVPELFWFDRELRAYFSPQSGPAPLAIVIAGTGGNANAAKSVRLRGLLYDAGYHVLTLPSPTFPRFIVAASSTGVAGDLKQDGRDLHRVIVHLLGRLRDSAVITGIHLVGYSLGAANAAVVKAIDDESGAIGIRNVVLINPPVSLFEATARLDRLLEDSVGDGDAAFERLYRRIYDELGRLYGRTGALAVDSHFLLAAAGTILETDAELAAAISLAFRLSLVDMFFAGDLYAGTGVVVDPRDPPEPGDSLLEISRTLRRKPFAAYFDEVFLPFYIARRPGATRESLIDTSHLRVIEGALRAGAYYAQTNRDELILNRAELEWLRRTFGDRLVVYDRGGHLGNLGERDQVEDMLDMLAGRFGRRPQ